MFKLEDCIAYVTAKETKKISDIFNKHFLKIGLTRAQWVVLYYLGQNDNIGTCGLADIMKIKHTTAVRIIKRMEQEGMIKKVRFKSDRRISHLHMTEKGKELRSKALPLCEKLSDIMKIGLEEEEVELYKKMLSKFVINLESTIDDDLVDRS